MTETANAPEVFRDWLFNSDHTQTDVAEILGVSRSAVSKWANGLMVPNRQRAADLETLSGGAVPATMWLRRKMPELTTPGGRAIQSAVSACGSVTRLSGTTGIPHRALARWATGECTPRKRGIAALNAALGLNLTPSDFEASA